MASPDEKDEAEKYNDWTLGQLQDECRKRNISFDVQDKEADLVSILIEDDKKPTDWAKIYARLLYHTGMHYEEIGRRTLPQINALLEEAGENISIKVGMPNIFGGSSSQPPAQTTANEPPKVSQFMAFANLFNGIK